MSDDYSGDEYQDKYEHKVEKGIRDTEAWPAFRILLCILLVVLASNWFIFGVVEVSEKEVNSSGIVCTLCVLDSEGATVWNTHLRSGDIGEVIFKFNPSLQYILKWEMHGSE
jgi:hypothetical protein